MTGPIETRVVEIDLRTNASIVLSGEGTKLKMDDVGVRLFSSGAEKVSYGGVNYLRVGDHSFERVGELVRRMEYKAEE